MKFFYAGENYGGGQPGKFTMEKPRKAMGVVGNNRELTNTFKQKLDNTKQ